MSNNPFKSIPSVTELLESPQLRQLVDKVSHNVVVSEVRSFLDNMREEIKSKTEDIPPVNEIADRIANWISSDQRPKLRPVINATGILLHTGLGRAPLAQEAIDEVCQLSRGYASVEINLGSGQRSQRVESVEKYLCELTGAEAALVANNNAGATLLSLAALASGKEVIVSRGELIEIGGSYRLPDVMTASGCTLREVGTTNKTRASDYQNAINEETGAIMKVHTSNFIVTGFTEAATTSELVSIGRKAGLPVIDDIGSGALINFSKYGLNDEPIAADSIEAGADVVLFSGDKLLGGPQCGIAIGRKEYITKMSKNPLMRALRVDKMTLGALAATLRLYRNQEEAEKSVPLLARLSTSMENLRNRAERIAPQLSSTKFVETAIAVESTTYLGGGSVPTQQLPTVCISINPAEDSVDGLARRLRNGETAVMGRVQQDRLHLDLRTIAPEQDAMLVSAFEALGQADNNGKPNE